MMFWSEPLKEYSRQCTFHCGTFPRITRAVLDDVIDLAHRELPAFGMPARDWRLPA